MTWTEAQDALRRGYVVYREEWRLDVYVDAITRDPLAFAVFTDQAPDGSTVLLTEVDRCADDWVMIPIRSLA
jgi:hypothetical protein